MNDELKQFLSDAFEPYGDFPARKDVEQELLANLTEKFNDLKADGKTDEEAYRLKPSPSVMCQRLWNTSRTKTKLANQLRIPRTTLASALPH